MTSRYDARESEPRWQRRWDEQGIFATHNKGPREKYYLLEIVPCTHLGQRALIAGNDRLTLSALLPSQFTSPQP
jgi:hypothetical protein